MTWFQVIFRKSPLAKVRAKPTSIFLQEVFMVRRNLIYSVLEPATSFVYSGRGKSLQKYKYIGNFSSVTEVMALCFVPCLQDSRGSDSGELRDATQDTCECLGSVGSRAQAGGTRTIKLPMASCLTEI